MRLSGTILAAWILSAVAPAPDAAAQVCRPNALGTISCPVERPKQRPLVEAEPRGLDRVLGRTRGDAPDSGFIPSRKTNSFGQTDPGAGGAASPRCRTDSLGATRC